MQYQQSMTNRRQNYHSVTARYVCDQWLKWFCEAGGGAHLTKPGWSKPHAHSNPTNLALFRHKITLYRFNQGGLIAGGSTYVQYQSMTNRRTELP